MSWIKVTRILDRDQAIAGLAQLRREWQEASEGKPLADVQASVGLLLADAVNALGLTPEETAQILGDESFVDAAQMRLFELAK